MKLPTHEYLERLDIPYQRLTFPSTTEKGAANVVKVSAYPKRQMIKTLIFETSQDERVLVVVGGDQVAPPPSENGDLSWLGN
jgi:Cys-tRNA(Pro)/Cys-tRNA(Cys) deacylase